MHSARPWRLRGPARTKPLSPVELSGNLHKLASIPRRLELSGSDAIRHIHAFGFGEAYRNRASYLAGGLSQRSGCYHQLPFLKNHPVRKDFREAKLAGLQRRAGKKDAEQESRNHRFRNFFPHPRSDNAIRLPPQLVVR